MNDKINRIIWVDIVKGFAIFLVVFGHQMLGTKDPIMVGLTKYIYSFHLPVFFIISGMFYNQKEGFKNFAAKKAKGLLIPYFSFAVILYLFWATIGKRLGSPDIIEISNIKGFFGIFYGNLVVMPWGGPLWFLLCLFVTTCIFYFIPKSNIKKTSLWLTVAATVGYMSTKLDFAAPWESTTAITGVVLFGAGYLLKDKFINSEDKTLNKYSTSFFLIVVGFVLSMINGRVEMVSNIYGNYLLFYLSSVSTSIGYIILFKKISTFKFVEKRSCYFTYFGKNSLIIMAFHGKTSAITRVVCTHAFGVDYHTLNIPNSILLSLITILMLIPVIYIINKYLPFLGGTFKKFGSQPVL